MQFQNLFDQFKAVADRKKEVYDADLEALIENQLHANHGNVWTLEMFTCHSGTGTLPSAGVSHYGTPMARSNAMPRSAMAPWMPCSRRSSELLGMNLLLTNYRVRSITVGEDALGEASVEVQHEGRTLTGRASSTDIIEASALALLQVINRIASRANTGRRVLPTEPVAS